MRRNLPLVAVVFLFLAAGVTYSLVTPIFEASDELSHYPVVKHLADGKGLPVQDPALKTAWNQEGSQPPLYYALAALATSWINTDDMSELLWYNPHANIGDPHSFANKNLVIHTAREAFPWHGTVLAIHLIRFLSVLTQAATVWFTYKLALAVMPDHTDLAWASAGLVAFNPMFLFIAGSVNNDNLVVPIAAFVLWRLAVMLRCGWPARWDIPVLGVTLGLAALTKLSGLALLPLAAAVLTVIAARKRAWRTWAGWGMALAITVAAIAGWWYVRNWQLYGDPTGLNVMLDVAGRRPGTFGLRDLLAEFEGFRLSYWGVFGGFNVVAWRWVYWLYDGLMVAALVGWVRRLARGWRAGVGRGAGLWARTIVRCTCTSGVDGNVMALLVTWVLLVGVALIRWTSQTYASQGRLLFPAVGAVAVLAVVGWAQLLPRAMQRWGLGAATAILAGLACVMPFAVIAPAYARPPLLVPDQIPETAARVDWVYEDSLRLLAYELPQPTVRPGEQVPVIVYWQALTATEEDLSVFVHLLGRDGAPVGNVGTYPGGGAYPTSLLRPGDVIQDRYLVAVAGDAIAPTLLRVDVGLYRYGAAEEVGLLAVAAADRPAVGPLGVVRLLPRLPSDFKISTPARFDLGGQVSMLGYDMSQVARPGEVMTLTLYWQAQARLSEDFQVFVHVLGPDGATVAQGDKAPLDGDWPTSAWEPGQTFADSYAVSLPATLLPGSYAVQAGLYRPADGWRLPVIGSEGPMPAGAMVLGQVAVPSEDAAQ